MFNFTKEILEKRNLISELVARELKVRYRRPALGFAWAFLSPLLTVAIFYVVFGIFLKVPSPETPFILYLMTAIFPWCFFQESVTRSATSLVENRNLIKESPFPHYFIPLSIVISNLITFCPPLIIIIIVSGIMLKSLSIYLLLLPVLLVLHLIFTTGVSIILSIIYIKWRDTKYILDALLLFLLYMTPVFYPLSLVKKGFPPFLYKLYIYNPLVGFVNCYRIIFLKGFYGTISYVDIPSLLICPALSAIIVLCIASFYYKIKKNKINDYLSY